MPDLSRRSLITGLVSLVASPAIVRAGSLMPIRVLEPRIIHVEVTILEPSAWLEAEIRKSLVEALQIPERLLFNDAGFEALSKAAYKAFETTYPLPFRSIKE